MRATRSVAPFAWLLLGGAAACATSGDPGAYGIGGGADVSVDTGGDGEPPDGTALAEAGDDAEDAAPLEASADSSATGKTCAGLADGTPCGPVPDVCHAAPVCSGGVCGAPAPKANGFVCAPAPDGCHSEGTCSSGVCQPPPDKPDGTVCASAPSACYTSGTCSGGVCGAPAPRADGYNWSSGDFTAICCSGSEVHADTSSNCGACGIKCNASNGESCSLLGGHYFCRGCVASSACWSKCCSESFSPFSCAASDCAGNCDSTYCPPGTHCVVGAPSSSDYCSY